MKAYERRKLKMKKVVPVLQCVAIESSTKPKLWLTRALKLLAIYVALMGFL